MKATESLQQCAALTQLNCIAQTQLNCYAHEYNWTVVNVQEHNWTLHMNTAELLEMYTNTEYSWTVVNVHKHRIQLNCCKCTRTHLNFTHEYSWTVGNVHEHRIIQLNCCKCTLYRNTTQLNCCHNRTVGPDQAANWWWYNVTQQHRNCYAVGSVDLYQIFTVWGLALCDSCIWTY